VELRRNPPFDSLPLEPGEVIRWQAWEPSFHRFSYYAIVVSDRAVYLYSRLFTSFTRWRRIPIVDVYAAEYTPSWFMPKLMVHHRAGKAVLRTPPDTGEAARIDREQIQEAVDVIRRSIGGT
jgi:hypothetical protein